MTIEQKIAMHQNRIQLLSGRKGVANTNIINKIQRRIRLLEKNT